MAFNYEKIGQTALRLLKEFGVAMTLRYFMEGEFDPVAGGYDQRLIVDYNCVGLIQSPTLSKTSSIGEVFFNGTQVIADDKFLLISAYSPDGLPLPKAPVVGNLLTVGEETFTIVALIPVAPGGIPLAYRILGRK